jgi:thiamine-phosphate pyrophosphorylase
MMNHAERMALFSEADLYVVITGAFCAGRGALDVLDACLDAGVRLVQMREKEGSDLDLCTLGRAFRERTRAAGALMIVDDRVDLALALDADGVHLGQTDLPIADARRIAPDLVIGASSHDPQEAAAAQDGGASYVNIGPVYATQTKSVPTGVVGLDMVDAIRPLLRVPFTCMGGIKAGNIGPVLAHGARHCAVVTAVTAAPDPRAAAAELRALIRAGRR